MKLIYTVLILCFIEFVQAGKDGKCRALVLSGGGDKGAYQASALVTLMKNLPQIETTYDTITGISAGNLNGALLATYLQDDQESFIKQIMELWNDIGFEDVLKFWPGGITEGLLL